jgi:opacity protein-like surface antigen
MKKIIALGLLTVAISAVAADDDCGCWINEKTGIQVPKNQLVPNGVKLDIGDPNHAEIPAVKSGHPDIIPDFPGADYTRLPSGQWINSKTGVPVPCADLVPIGAKLNIGDPNHAEVPAVKSGHPDIIPDFPGASYVRVPCPEEKPSSTPGGVKTAAAPTAPANDLFQLSLGYNFMRTDKEDVKNLHGFQVAGFYNVNSWLAVGGEFSGLFGTDTRHYSMVNEHVSLDRYLYMFGPQVTFQPIPQVPQIQLVGHVLAGGVHDENEFRYSGMTHRSSANAFALTVGGGVDVQVTRQITIGPVFDYTPTAFPASNGHNWQNNWRVGVVGKFSF